MADTVTLFCLIRGESIGNALEAQVGRDEIISALKKDQRGESGAPQTGEGLRPRPRRAAAARSPHHQGASWTASRETTTLDIVKGKLRGCFEFPDGTEDQQSSSAVMQGK